MQIINHKKQVLWVGDTPSDIQPDQNFSITSESDPGVALARLSVEPCAAIVLDAAGLPDPAFQILDQIQHTCADIPVVVLIDGQSPVSSIIEWVNGIRNLRLVVHSARQEALPALLRQILADQPLACVNPPETVSPSVNQELARLTRQATIDNLTGLLRREEMFNRCEEDFERSTRMSQPGCCVMGDIDHFKRINDVFGHPMGDRTLQQVARLLSQGRRRYDRVGRVGGEEFLLFFYGVEFAEGRVLAERLRKSIENFAWEEDSLPPVTMSFGVSERVQGDFETFKDMVKAADDALYEAKRNGRNQVRAKALDSEAADREALDASPSEDNRPSILVVDDTPAYLDQLKALLGVSYRVDVTPDPLIALKKAERSAYDLVLSDEHMSGMYGHQLLARMKSIQPGCVRFIMTAHGGLNTAIKAINQGEVHYFVLKPWKDEELLLAIHQALEQQSMVEKLRTSDRETVMALVDTLELKDRSTRGHYHRVAVLSLKIARQLGYSDRRCESLEYAAWLHDVGKVGIPDQVLLKHGPLTPDEEKMLRDHPQLGANLVASVDHIAPVAPIIRHHHERFDGKGYPDGLKGRMIPEEARIIAIANTYDGLLSVRRERPALSPEAALGEILARCQSLFDPDLVATFEKIIGKSPSAETGAGVSGTSKRALD